MAQIFKMLKSKQVFKNLKECSKLDWSEDSESNATQKKVEEGSQKE